MTPATVFYQLYTAVPVVLYGLCAIAVFRYRALPEKALIIRAWGFLAGIKLALLALICIGHLIQNAIGEAATLLLYPFFFPELSVLKLLTFLPSTPNSILAVLTMVVVIVIPNGLIALVMVKVAKLVPAKQAT